MWGSKILLSLISLALPFLACQTEQQLVRESVIIKTGAERLVEDGFSLLKGKKVGFVTNHTAIVDGKHLADIMYESQDVNLVALFGPEHGIRGDAGGHIDSSTDESTGLPVHSLYGETRKPTTEMLEGIDLLLFDIQDIGPRFYTYISTLGKVMEAAAEHNIPVMVLDRPNPLGGKLAEGFVLEREFESFVGYFPIPVTHGLTIGEFANMVKGEGMREGLENLDLQVVEMVNWRRNLLWSELGREWVRTSPNMPSFETALIYPGACFFERVNGSTGRGTPDPFIVLGTPWADGEAIAADLNARNLPGLKFEGVRFTPDREPKVEQNGIRYIITDPHAVRPVEAGIHVLHAFHTQGILKGHDDFIREGISRHAGTQRLYNSLTAGASAEEVIASWSDELAEFDTVRRRYFLYE